MGDLPESCGVGSHRGACISAELRRGAVESRAAHQILTRDYQGEKWICLACFSNREAVVDWKMQQKKSSWVKKEEKKVQSNGPHS